MMRNQRRLLARTLVVCLCGLSTEGSAEWAAATPDSGIHLGQVTADSAGIPVIARVTGLVSSYMSTHRVPGLVMAIIKDGELAWAQGFGEADLENHVPASTNTVFRSGSIGKTMTATAAMQLVEQHRLDLNADVRRYCPAFPAEGSAITPLELLSHSSGIRHYGGPHDAEEQTSLTHYNSVAAALEPFKNDPLLFEPGTEFSYSSYGFDLLGCVIEGAAGVPFLAYMRQHVWDAAGMTTTRDDDPSALIPGRASGYILVGGEVRHAPPVDMSNRMPAGGYVLSVLDLARFTQAEMAGALVRPETFERMITPARLTSGIRIPYGLGWGVELERWHDDTWVFHGGSTPGFSGFIALMPRHRFAVMYLANLEGLPERSELAEAITRAVLGL
jgi:serine beta-lactamase-like protein LACTB